jgi:hypothetical protein
LALRADKIAVYIFYEFQLRQKSIHCGFIWYATQCGLQEAKVATPFHTPRTSLIDLAVRKKFVALHLNAQKGKLHASSPMLNISYSKLSA